MRGVNATPSPGASGVGVVPALQAVRAAVISLPAGPGGPVRRAPVAQLDRASDYGPSR